MALCPPARGSSLRDNTRRWARRPTSQAICGTKACWSSTGPQCPALGSFTWLPLLPNGQTHISPWPQGPSSGGGTFTVSHTGSQAALPFPLQAPSYLACNSPLHHCEPAGVQALCTFPPGPVLQPGPHSTRGRGSQICVYRRSDHTISLLTRLPAVPFYPEPWPSNFGDLDPQKELYFTTDFTVHLFL